MAYSIVILHGEQELSRTPFDSDLGSAKTLAIEQFKAQYEQNNATSVRVIDTDHDDNVVFSYSEDVHVPRTGA
jgi:hypothetical protein